MEVEERGEDRRAPGMETDVQRGVEGTSETVSTGKAQVHVHVHSSCSVLL
jgi:hypothetical protein